MRGSTAGIGDGLTGISSTFNNVITVLDQIVSAIVITPLVVGYWRGTWCCMDKFVYEHDPKTSVFISIIIGFVGSMIFTLAQNILLNNIQRDENRVKYYLITRLYSASFGVVCVNQFRGVWQFLDIYTTTDTASIVTITIVSIITLGCTKTLRNLSAPPFAVTVDRYEDYFCVPTFLKCSSDKLWLYLWDCMFSVCIIGTLVVIVWRGTWCLLDITLFPSNPALSAWASMGIGYILVLITFSLQPAMKYLAKTLTGLFRLIVVDIYLLFSFCGTVNVWRGIWNLLNHYFLPGAPAISFILTHSVSFLILMLINASNSILVRGVYLDCEEHGEQCVDFPCYYIRLYFQTRRQKKLLKECERRLTSNKQNGEIETEKMLGETNKNKIVIVPMNQNNNDHNPQIV